MQKSHIKFTLHATINDNQSKVLHLFKDIPRLGEAKAIHSVLRPNNISHIFKAAYSKQHTTNSMWVFLKFGGRSK
jgi:hypothetical protein